MKCLTKSNQQGLEPYEYFLAMAAKRNQKVTLVGVYACRNGSQLSVNCQDAEPKCSPTTNPE